MERFLAFQIDYLLARVATYLYPQYILPRITSYLAPADRDSFHDRLISVYLMRPIVQKAIRIALSSPTRSYHASVLPSLISTSSPEFHAKAKAMDNLVADVERKMAQARAGGSAKAAERMRSKGKKLPRERLGRAMRLSFASCLPLTALPPG